MRSPLRPDRQAFASLAKTANCIPVWVELAWDLETAVSLYQRTGGGADTFLLESVEGPENSARYSFVGLRPRSVLQATTEDLGLALEALQASLKATRPAQVDGLPRFWGGWVGMLGYDVSRCFESLPARDRREDAAPSLYLMETDSLFILDHFRHRILALVVARPEEEGGVEASYRLAGDRIEDLLALLDGDPARRPEHPGSDAGFSSDTAPETFRDRVEQAREYIRAGDVIQVVLSQRFSAPRGEHCPFSIYRRLRRINPSPYLFFLRMQEQRTLLGASPETLVRVEDGCVEVRPIAGTRPRGSSGREDEDMERELRGDPKERAEHLMLLDLGRNDVGRVSEAGTVEVVDPFRVERYSHVMHLVSTVRGRVRGDQTVLDVLAATFPAGTLSGAPKVRAMELIEEMETQPRGTYGGAVGYFGYNDNLDLCITIRSLLCEPRGIHVQAGAGVVYDSDPESERRETEAKAGALFRAVAGTPAVTD